MVHEKENSSKIKRRVLSYDYIGEKLGELLKAFLEGIIYIDHLPDSIDKTNKFGPDRMILILLHLRENMLIFIQRQKFVRKNIYRRKTMH